MNEERIKVKVDSGWVTLEGEVHFRYEKVSAQNNVKELAGVRGVTNNIQVRVKEIDTKEIKIKSRAFHRNACLDAKAIQLHVSGSG